MNSIWSLLFLAGCFILSPFLVKGQLHSQLSNDILQQADQNRFGVLNRHETNQGTLRKGRPLLTDIISLLVFGLYKQAERNSNFPTVFTSGDISERCRNDSQDYYAAYLQQVNWALKSAESFLFHFSI